MTERSRDMFRSNGSAHAANDAPWRGSDRLVTALVVTFIALMYVIASDSDACTEHELQRISVAERTRQALPHDLAAAYERGLTDAMQSLQITPQGVVLAQLCNVAPAGARK